MKHFTHLNDLRLSDLEQVLERAQALKDGAAASPMLKRKTLGMLFLNPSLRTRASFDVAMQKLGGHALALDAGTVWNLETDEAAVMNADRPEHIKEAARVLSRYVDVLGVRAFSKGSGQAEEQADATIMNIRKYATVPVISLESAREHPCQGLADLLTMRQIHGRSKGLKVSLVWAPHIKSLPRAVPNSVLLSAMAGGAQLTVAHPPGYGLAPEVIAQAGQIASESGARLSHSDDAKAAIDNADIVYVKSWGPSAEFARAPENPVLKHWMLEAEELALRAPNASFMHCLPVRRNVEVAGAVLDGPQSRVIDQAENRLWAQMAALEWLFH
jgi:N-acetylornithine carbamoyltransferase